MDFIEGWQEKCEVLVIVLRLSFVTTVSHFPKVPLLIQRVNRGFSSTSAVRGETFIAGNQLLIRKKCWVRSPIPFVRVA